MLQYLQTNLACFGPHDKNQKLTTLCKQEEVPILADPENDLLLSYSAPSMKECRSSNILRAQLLSSYTAQKIGYPQLPVLHQLQFSVKSTMTRLLDKTSPLLEYVSSRWHGRYKRKLPCTACFTSALKIPIRWVLVQCIPHQQLRGTRTHHKKNCE